MAGVSREVRAERVRYWQGLIEEHSRSGLSVLEFCKERKVAATDDATEDGKASDDKGAEDKSKPKRNHKGRRRLPANITREIVRHELSEEDRKCPCCPQSARPTGAYGSKARVRLNEIRAPRRACPV